jgi:hypothetical protein
MADVFLDVAVHHDGCSSWGIIECRSPSRTLRLSSGVRSDRPIIMDFVHHGWSDARGLSGSGSARDPLIGSSRTIHSDTIYARRFREAPARDVARWQEVVKRANIKIDTHG